MAAVLNLLPIPPLDGFGAIAYWLPEETRNFGYSVGMYAFILLFVVLWYVPPVSQALFNGVDNLLNAMGVDPLYAAFGYDNFFFWKH